MSRYTAEQIATLPRCSCPFCPAKFEGRCDCGLYFRDENKRWRCGRHDSADRPIGEEPKRYKHPSAEAARKRALFEAGAAQGVAARGPAGAETTEDANDPTFLD